MRRTSLSAKAKAWVRQCRKVLRSAKNCAELARLASVNPAHASFKVDYSRRASTVPMYKRAGKRR